MGKFYDLSIGRTHDTCPGGAGLALTEWLNNNSLGISVSSVMLSDIQEW